jgi:hypothetical protein
VSLARDERHYHLDKNGDQRREQEQRDSFADPATRDPLMYFYSFPQSRRVSGKSPPITLERFDYTESGQVIPVWLRGRKGSYSHCMFLNDHPPVAGGRELWGFPKKLASPTLRTEIDTVVGTLDYGSVR